MDFRRHGIHAGVLTNEKLIQVASVGLTNCQINNHNQRKQQILTEWMAIFSRVGMRASRWHREIADAMAYAECTVPCLRRALIFMASCLLVCLPAIISLTKNEAETTRSHFQATAAKVL